MNKLTLGSLFDGSGGFPLAGVMAGIEPVWASEIEPFPIRVTTKRIPQMKHYGDVSALDGGKIEPVDVITFGSPCQNLSLAGNRSGLDGEKSSLFFEAVRVIKEMRSETNGQYPRWIVWENVPGAFSSNKGRDFKAVLDAVCSVKDETAFVPEPANGKWTAAGEIMADDYSIAWRVLDAQYHGVPQRRKRIFLIADLDGGSAGKILFESKSVPWHTPPGFREGQEATGDIGEGTDTSGNLCLNDQGGSRMDVTNDVTATLRARANNHVPCVMRSAGFCTEHSSKSRGIGYDMTCLYSPYKTCKLSCDCCNCDISFNSSKNHTMIFLWARKLSTASVNWVWRPSSRVSRDRIKRHVKEKRNLNNGF